MIGIQDNNRLRRTAAFKLLVVETHRERNEHPWMNWISESGVGENRWLYFLSSIISSILIVHSIGVVSLETGGSFEGIIP